MTITRRQTLAGAAAAGFASMGGEAGAAASLAYVLRRHTLARGGAGRLDRIHNMVSRIEIEEQGSKVQAVYRASTAARMRIDVLAGGKRVWSEGLDAAGGWAWPGGDATAKPESATGVAALKHGVEFNLFGLHRYAERGHHLTLDGRETIEGIDYHVIRIDLSDGFRTWRYIDARTWMIGRGRDVRAIHPDLDATPNLLENVFEDYRSADGVMTSFRSRQVNVLKSEVLQRTQVLSQKYNAAMPKGVFERTYTGDGIINR